jgi:type I restriction enzyme S subunit
MIEWKEFKFSEFVSINPKVTFEQRDLLPFVEMKDIEPSNKFCSNSNTRSLSGGARFINGDTLFARITPCLENGKIAQVRNLKGGKGFGSTEFHVLRGKDEISDTDFVYYLSRWSDVRDFAEINLHGTSGRQRFPAEAFKELILTLPPLPEQERIAEVLSSLDDKIDLLQRQNKTLEEMAETLFRLWLTKLKDRDLTTLGDYTKVQNGYAFKSNDFKDLGKNGVLKITNISFEQVDIHNTQFVDDIVVSNLSEKFVVFPKSFLIAMTGAEIGKIGIVGKTAKKLYINQRVGMLVDVLTNSSLLGYLFLKSAEGQDHIINTCTGSAQENISSLGIESMIVPQSTNDEVTEICESVNPLFEKIISNLEQIQHLETLRDTLLPKLMSGSVTVNEIA